MKKLKSYIGLALIGGLLVILPMAVFIFVGRWLLGTLGSLISPLSDPIMAVFELPPLMADFMAIIAFLSVCLIVGVLVRTAFGRWAHHTFDQWMSKLAPGYKTIRAMIHQLISGSGGGPLKGEVVLAQIFGADVSTTMTGIVTSKHADGRVTVYVPTAPVPTSGLTYHLPAECVQYLPNVSVEEAMRTIIACGAGTSEMFEAGA